MADDKEETESAGEASDNGGKNVWLGSRSIKILEALSSATGIPKSHVVALGALALERELGDEEMFIQLPELAAILGALDAKIGDILLEADYARKLVVQALSVEVDLPLQVLGQNDISGAPDAD